MIQAVNVAILIDRQYEIEDHIEYNEEAIKRLKIEHSVLTELKKHAVEIQPVSFQVENETEEQ